MTIRAVVLLLVLAGPARAGFFHVEKHGAQWWLVDGAGAEYLHAAPNVTELGGPVAEWKAENPAYCGLKFYPSPDAWADATRDRLKAWGFTGVGGYSDHDLLGKRGLPYTVALPLGAMYGAPWLDPRDPGNLKAFAGELAKAKALRDDPLLVGYFTDNELGWYDESVFFFWMGQPAKSRVKRALFTMLEAQYHGDLRAFRADLVVTPTPRKFSDLRKPLESVRWAPGRRPAVADRFVEWLADEYYDTMATALRRTDPNHLLLGDRYASSYSQPVARAAGRHMDVISANYNTFASSGWIAPAFFESLYRLSQKPVMVTEYYFAAMENATGDGNTSAGFMTVATQAQRAAGAARMTEHLARLPYVVGWHWFQFADEPPHGRGDGEDYNFGLVDVNDRPYPALTAALAAVQSRAMALHREGPRPDGLVRVGGEFRLPRATWTLSLDGRMDEWDLPATWVPEAGAREPYQPFGDFHLAWTPAGLVVGMVYRDFAEGREGDGDPLSFPRITVAVQCGDQLPATVTVGGLGARIGPPPPEPTKGEKKADDTRPYAPLLPLAPVPPGMEGVRGAQAPHSIETIAELLIPAAALGAPALAAGEALRVAVSIRLRGDVKETFWPVALSAGVPAGEALAAVRLVEGTR